MERAPRRPADADYDSRWMAMADAGESVHGEVDLVMSLLAEHEFGDSPRVLDAGCGTGRVAIELAARGVDVAGGTEAAVLANMARHVCPGGVFVAGFQTGGHRPGVEAYDEHAEAAGLALVDRWSTWDRAPFANGDYVVSAHRRI